MIKWFGLVLGSLVFLACSDEEFTSDGGGQGATGAHSTGASSSGGSGARTSTGGAGGQVATGGQFSGGSAGQPQGGQTQGGFGGQLSCPGTAPGCVDDWAGQWGVQGAIDGVGQAARFFGIAGITSTGGYVYVTDNHAIRRIEIATGSVETWLGSLGQAGLADSPNPVLFNNPSGITTNGRFLWVADAGNFVIREIELATGNVRTLVGMPGQAGMQDDPAVTGIAFFNGLRDITHDGIHLYVVEGVNHAVRRIDPSTGAVVTVAGGNGPGLTDGLGTTAQLNVPRHIVALGPGNLYVGDTENHRPRHVDGITATNLVGSVSSPYGSSQGYQDGVGNAAMFNRLRGVTHDGSNLIIADSDNFVIRSINLGTDTVDTLAGQAGVKAHVVDTYHQAGIDKPLDIHYDPPTGDLFIAEGTVLRRMYWRAP